MRWSAGVGALVLAGCGPAAPARFANWEPVRDDLPVAANRAEAAARLRASYELWRKWRDAPPPTVLETGRMPSTEGFGYTYVRGRQASPSEVTFTVVAVRGGSVVLRALLSAEPGQLSSFPRRAGQSHPIGSKWVERGSAIGSHADAAPAKTIDELYAQCAELIAQAETTPPRLYFHPDGLLMQCGYPPEQCAACPSPSISSLSRFLVDGELPQDDAAAWLCETETGPVPPGGALPFFTPEWACFAAAHPTPRVPGELTPEICVIDPAACPPPEAGYGVAHLTLVRPPICPTSAARSPRPLDVGKADPQAEWTFPFQTGASIECSAGTFLRRRGPERD